MNDPSIAGILGVENPFVFIELGDIPPPPNPPIPLQGLLVDNIKIITEPIDTIVYLFDGSGDYLDSLIIHVPEPATLLLLGLGGLVIRRRK